jgi:hypothetical protein
MMIWADDMMAPAYWRFAYDDMMALTFIMVLPLKFFSILANENEL